MFSKICKYSKCGKPFETKYSKQKYCNESCRVGAWREKNYIIPKDFIKKFQELALLRNEIKEIKKHLGISDE